MAETKSLKIFLSYAAEQIALAERLYLSLASGGHEVFFDRTGIRPGVDFNEIILSQIRHSDLLIYLISPQSVAEGAYARTELRFAQDVWRTPGGHVLPVMVKPTPMEDVPNYLRAVSILVPHGDVVAEVSAAVRDMATGWKSEYTVLSQGRSLEEVKRDLARLATQEQLKRLEERWIEKWGGSKVSEGTFVVGAVGIVAFAMFSTLISLNNFKFFFNVWIWHMAISAAIFVLCLVQRERFSRARSEHQRERARILRGERKKSVDEERFFEWLDHLEKTNRPEAENPRKE